MKSLYLGWRFDDAGRSLSESLAYAVDEANETALFWRNDIEDSVFERLRIGTEGCAIDKDDDGTLNADESPKRLLLFVSLL